MDIEHLIKKRMNNFPNAFKQEESMLVEVDQNSLVLREINRRRERASNNATFDNLTITKKKDQKEIDPTIDSYFEKIKFKQKSKAGKKWNERTIKKLIYMVLIMNIGMTIFDSSLYLSLEDVWDTDIIVVGELIKSKAVDSTNIDVFMKNMMERYSNNSITFVSINVTSYYSYRNKDLNLNDYRVSEMGQATYNEGLEISFLVDVKTNKFFDSLFQLLSMIFIVITLVATYIFSSKDSQIFISGPVRQLASIFNAVLMNPLDIVFNPHYLSPQPERDMLEDLEQEYSMIGNKTCQLAIWLSCCFGKNKVPLITNRFIMTQPSSLTSMVGDKYCAYFSIIEIQNFMDNLTIEDEDGVALVQQMTDIIFRTTDLYNGGASYLKKGKFFLIWKLKHINRDSNFKKVARDSSETASVIISANLKILYGLAYTHKLYEIPFTQYNLARGTIHCGVVHESIVGSPLHKIDVQYFGLDLAAIHLFHEMSNRYKTSVLLTEHLYTIIPECMKVKCRKIDVIKLPFYPQPLDIYTIDLRLDQIELTEQDRQRETVTKTYKKRLAHVKIKDHVEDKVIKGAKNTLFLEDPDLEGLLSRNFEFRKNFRNSIDFYILGAWDSAKPFLKKALELEPEDGPSKFLWNFMEAHNFEKPASWRGFRASSKILK